LHRVIEKIIKIPKNRIKMIYNEVYENNLSRAYVLHVTYLYNIYTYRYIYKLIQNMVCFINVM